MYNKLFTKILDSSIWLESDATRLVWLTLLAAMDEDGFAQFASVANLAHRARVTLDACTEAARCLEAPDANSGDPDHGGRRLERVDGGWVVLNAGKYRLMVTRVVAREQTRERVRKFRAKAAGNAPVTVANDLVTPSEAEAVANTEANTEAERAADGAFRPAPIQARGASEPGSLPRDHMRHALCGPQWKVCLKLPWQRDALITQYNHPDPKAANVALIGFLEVLESSVGPNDSIGDFRWVEKNFQSWLKSVGRAPKTLEPKHEPFSIEKALAIEAQRKAERMARGATR
jgi:hypothetical protein